MVFLVRKDVMQQLYENARLRKLAIRMDRELEASNEREEAQDGDFQLPTSEYQFVFGGQEPPTLRRSARLNNVPN